MSNWDKYHLEEVCHKITDGTHKTPKYVDEGVVFLSAKNVKNGILDFSEHKYISLEEHNQLTKRCKPETGDVMLSKSGSLGDAVVVPQLPYEFSIFESLALIKINRLSILPLYLQQYLNSPLSRRYFRSITSGIAVKHLHLVDLRRMPIFVPPLEIQRQIVDFLEQWDTAIEKTEALIDAKERQFGWLQNTLIRENSDKWPTKPLNSLSQIKKGKQLNRDTLDDSVGYPVWNGGITPSGYTDKSNTASNTITISEGGNSCGFVNFCKEDFWLGGHCYAVTKLDVSLYPDFLFFCLKANERRIMRLRVGSGLPNIQKKDIEKLQIQFPEMEEQKRIAHTLNTAKEEINLLKKLADQYRTQKRGLMQKLLSGQSHIKNKEAA